MWNEFEETFKNNLFFYFPSPFISFYHSSLFSFPHIFPQFFRKPNIALVYSIGPIIPMKPNAVSFSIAFQINQQHMKNIQSA